MDEYCSVIFNEKFRNELNILKFRVAKWFMCIYKLEYYLAMRRQISIDIKRDPCCKKHDIKYYE